MRRLIGAAIVVVVLVLAGGLVICAIPRLRDAAARAECQNNLQQIGLALHNYCDTYTEVFPPAAIPNESLPCGDRLSWLVGVMPFIEQNHMMIDRDKGWRDEKNIIPKVPQFDPHTDREIGPPLPVGEIKMFRCPVDRTVSSPDAAGLTNYVGISGVGVDAAELPLGYPGVGFFGCERKIKREDIKDGLANTVAVMETHSNLGPWTAASFPTVRPFDPAKVPYLGAGRPFGSGHWKLTQAVFADGSVRSLPISTPAQVLQAMATIAGGEEIAPLGD